MDEESRAREIRQLQHMLGCLASMRRDQRLLVDGVDSLLFLRDALEEVDAQWSRELTNHLATLESAGVATPEQIRTMGKEYPELIARTLDAVERLVRSSLSQRLAEGGAEP